MFLILSSLVLANANAVVHSSTFVEGEGTTYTKIQTTVNGNTTTVESNEPGSIQVEKTDTTENITSDIPVTVTHTPLPQPTPEASATSKPKELVSVNINHYWTALLRTLWDRVKSFLSFALLTRK